MSIEVIKTAGDQLYGHPFVSPIESVDHVKVDVSGLTNAEVDAKGYLKPGVPLKQDGTLANATSGEFIYGMTIEASKIPGRTDNANLGSDTSDPLVAVVTHALVNRDIAEDILGRAFTTNELAAMKAAGSRISVTST